MGELWFEDELGKDLWDLVSTRVWWNAPVGDWVLALRLVPQDGHAVIGEMRLFPKESNTIHGHDSWSLDASAVPDGGLLSKDLKAVKPAGELLAARRQLVEHMSTISTENWENMRSWQDPSDLGHPLLDAGFSDSRRIGTSTIAERRPGRPGHPLGHWLWVAVTYDRATRSGSSHPNQDVAAAVSGIHVDDVPDEDVRLAADWVRTCRKKGLIGPAPGSGQAGGGLTQKAKEMLGESQNIRPYGRSQSA